MKTKEQVEAKLKSRYPNINKDILGKAVEIELSNDFEIERGDYYLLERKSGNSSTYNLIVSIDALRKIATRIDPNYGIELLAINLKGEEKSLVASDDLLGAKAILTRGSGAKIIKAVLLKEFSTGRSTWASIPYVMIAKVAEAHVLRTAYPNEMQGLYTNDEMAQADHKNPSKTEDGETANKIKGLKSELLNEAMNFLGTKDLAIRWVKEKAIEYFNKETLESLEEISKVLFKLREDQAIAKENELNRE